MMKSNISSRLLVNLLLPCTILPAIACGPFSPIIPTPEFFALSGTHKSMSCYNRNENLRLWQSQTSARIPLRDIEEAVYHDSRARFDECTGDHPDKTSNLFYTYINNTADEEVREFLRTAKILEERREKINSPWYYPSSRNSTRETGDFNDIINLCNSNNSSRLNDLYALQAVRALFASRQYDRCIEYYDSAFRKFPHRNLMKRMAQRYAAGCWSRLGHTKRADSIFAVSGDIWSITGDNPVKYMARHNPSAPQLIEYIRSNASDTAFMKSVMPVAEQLLKKSSIPCKGDWEFLLAYCNNEYCGKTTTARGHIYRALQQKFSTDKLKDLARAYKMKLDARSGRLGSLLSDLKWIEQKTDVFNPDANEWIRRMRNIIYVDWIPRLWNQNDFSTAILLCAYADNLETFQKRQPRCIDYSSLSFQLMGSLSSARLATAYQQIKSDTPLYSFLRRAARTDNDYYNELIGTLALREENYDRAISYLSNVSPGYQLSMNIVKGRYLSRDPFTAYPTRWEVVSDYDIEYESIAAPHPQQSQINAKLNFAHRMRSYRHAIKHGSTSDERGLARLMYAIGLRNSLEECWALTQYWRGSCTGIFYPALQYRDNDFADNRYGFVYDYEKSIGHRHTEEVYNREVAAATAMLKTDEARAKAAYILGNLKTVIRNYPSTSTAAFIKTSCDNWQSWL